MKWLDEMIAFQFDRQVLVFNRESVQMEMESPVSTTNTDNRVEFRGDSLDSLLVLFENQFRVLVFHYLSWHNGAFR